MLNFACDCVMVIVCNCGCDCVTATVTTISGVRDAGPDQEGADRGSVAVNVPVTVLW